MEHERRLTLGADQSSALHFSRDELESVQKGEASADALLTAKTHELMALTGETDFTRAFERVAKVNPDMHKLYMHRRS